MTTITIPALTDRESADCELIVLTAKLHDRALVGLARERAAIIEMAEQVAALARTAA